MYHFSLSKHFRSASTAIIVLCAPFSAAAQSAYKDTPGNEFEVCLTGPAFPEGKWIIVDPDDMVLMPHPQTRKLDLAPRLRLLTGINAQLPAIPGATEALPPKPGEELSAMGTPAMLKHLTDPRDKGGHGLDKGQLTTVFWLCHEPLGLAPPTRKPGAVAVEKRPIPPVQAPTP